MCICAHTYNKKFPIDWSGGWGGWLIMTDTRRHLREGGGMAHNGI